MAITYPLSDGGFVEATYIQPSYSNPGGYSLQRYSAGGDPMGASVLTGGTPTTPPVIDSTSDGGYTAISWYSRYDWSVNVVRVDADGESHQLTHYNSSSRPQATVTALSDGGVVVALTTGPQSRFEEYNADSQLVRGADINGYGLKAVAGEDGDYTLNWSSPDGAPHQLVVDQDNPPDFTPPPTPEILGVDDVPLYTGIFHSGAVINDPEPVIRMMVSTAGDVISNPQTGQTYTVTEHDASVGFVDVTSFFETSHNVTLRLTTPTGAYSQAAFSFTVDNDSPDAPTFGAVFDNEGASQGQLASGAVTDDATPQVRLTLSGLDIGQGDQVILLVDGQLTPSKLVSADDLQRGYMVFTPELSPGEHALTARVIDRAGNQSPDSGAFHLTVEPADGTLPSLSLAGPGALAEGDEGVTSFDFTVTRTGDLSGETLVDYYLWTDATAPRAQADDFSGPLAGTVAFGAGESEKVIHIAVNGDAAPELDDVFNISLANPRGATIAEGTARAVILDDDVPAPESASLSISGPGEVLESDGESGFQFVVTRDGDTSGETLVDYFLWSNQTSADDFIGATAGTVAFAAGETSKVITIHVADDAEVEDAEGFNVTLSNARGAAIDQDTAAATILDDDGDTNPPATTVSIAGDISQAESDEGSIAFTFTVSRTGDASAASLVDWFVWGDTDADDFEGATAGTVYFDAGETAKSIVVHVTGDSDFETDEAFHVTLSNLRGGELGATTATGTILNDDLFGVG